MTYSESSSQSLGAVDVIALAPTDAFSKVQSSSENEVISRLGRVIGIDKLSFSARLRSYDEDPRSWWTIRRHGRLEVPLPAKTGSSPVHVRVFPDHDVLWGTVDFNPSRFFDPDGVGLAPISSLPGCIADAMRIAGDVIELAEDVSSARVKRVDVTRDITDVGPSSSFIKGFLGALRPNATVTTLSLGTGGVIEGISSGSRSGGRVLLYDKSIESNGRAPEGTLRFEAQCRAWAQSQGGIRCVRDLTEERLATLAWNRWCWSGFGSFVAGVPQVLELVNRSGYDDRGQRDLKAYVLLAHHDQLGRMAPGTKSRYAKRLAKLGLHLPILPDIAESSESVRYLDLIDGTAKVLSLTEGQRQ
ncbi:MAG TPA: hypothetical protein VMV22_07570 [Acidimicrobiales bacterium]|nr:hypothetical protein [Acidimicrobiales bacterium]